MLTAECPCCHGKKVLETICEDMLNSPIIYFPCAHCDDTGRVTIAERYFRNALWQFSQYDEFSS